MAVMQEVLKLGASMGGGAAPKSSVLRYIECVLDDGRTVTPPEALESYQAAVVERPEDAGALVRLGNCLRDLGREGEGLKYLKRGVQEDPSYVEAALVVAEAESAAGQVEEAFECLDRTLREKARWRFLRLNASRRELWWGVFVEKYNGCRERANESGRPALSVEEQ